MPNIEIKLMVAIEGFVLVVYYLPQNCYQLSIIDKFNEVFDFDDIFYTVEAAEILGRAAIKEEIENG